MFPLFIIGYLFLKPETTKTEVVVLDTPSVNEKIKLVDTFINVKDKIAMFIGDSHTANNVNGWQAQLCQATGMKMTNLSVGGKTTYWMLQVGTKNIKKGIDYCFIYGGANDMYSGTIKPQKALSNVQLMVNICKENGVKAVVITGFDPKVTNTKSSTYVKDYIELQKLFMDSLTNATVIDTRVVDKKDCWDVYCHMAPSGHKKISHKIIKDMKLKTK